MGGDAQYAGLRLTAPGGRSTASRAGAGWSFQPPPEPKKLIDHNAHTQKHQYDDDGGLHLLIIPRGWRGRVLFRPPFAPRGLVMAFQAAWMGYSALMWGIGVGCVRSPFEANPGGSPNVENTAQPGFAAYQPCLR